MGKAQEIGETKARRVSRSQSRGTKAVMDCLGRNWGEGNLEEEARRRRRRRGIGLQRRRGMKA